MSTPQELYLGIEIGATKQQLALADADGEPLGMVSGKFPLPNGAANIRGWLLAEIPRLIARQGEFGGGACAIGAGFGGVLESKPIVQRHEHEAFKKKVSADFMANLRESCTLHPRFRREQPPLQRGYVLLRILMA
ncbi:MAG: hypothetical protein ABSF26_20685 [Thermoguttaceae bacterium]|jgi:predicted NBD/HSP70 family sugar kinase